MNKLTHHPFIIFFHWLTFGLILLALFFIELKNLLPKNNLWYANFLNYHTMIGQIILLVVVLRMITKLMVTSPVDQEKTLSRKIKKMIHALIYVFMLGLPITGILLVGFSGASIPFIGNLLNRLLAENQALHTSFQYIHTCWGKAIYFLVGAHIMMAIGKRCLLKDRTLFHFLLHRGTRSH
jgi:cytochrome b561